MYPNPFNISSIESLYGIAGRELVHTLDGIVLQCGNETYFENSSNFSAVDVYNCGFEAGQARSKSGGAFVKFGLVKCLVCVMTLLLVVDSGVY